MNMVTKKRYIVLALAEVIVVVVLLLLLGIDNLEHPQYFHDR